jgi:hypothetical protein
MSTTESAARTGTVMDRASNPFGNAPIVAAPGASASALVAREAQDILVQMMCARNNPRDAIRSVDRVINAFSRPTLCEDATYEYARGGTNVSGLSIRAAEVLAQNWGNIRCGVAEMSRANGQSEFLAYAQDLETGYSDEKRFFVRHWRDTKQGGYLLTDERDIYEVGANMAARRKRACILAVIPKDVQDAAEHQIQLTLKSKAEVTDEAIKNLLDAFSKYGVTREMIEKRIQRHLDAMLPAQLIQMRRIFTSLKDGMSTPAEWFEMAAAAATDAASGPAADDKPRTQTSAVKEALKGKKGAAASQAEPEGQIPQHSKETAVKAIKDAKTLKELEAVYTAIVEDFTGTKRDMPVEVEAAYGDHKAALEQKQS